MRSILFTLLLVGCADDSTLPNATAESDCDHAWTVNDPGKCDLACQMMPTADELTGADCDVTESIVPMGASMPFRCPSTLEFGGSRGCCYDTYDPKIISGRTRNVFFLTCK